MLTIRKDYQHGKLEQTLSENFDNAINRITDGILNGSISATLEGSSDFADAHSRCSVRIFERYSAFGQNRVSLSVTLFQGESGAVQLSAIASGGSQAMFLKVNTFGEEAFLNKLRELL